MFHTGKLFVVSAAAAAAAAGIVIWAAELSALKAAGLSGVAPKGGDAFVGLVRTLEQNWIWLVGTGLGLVLVLIAGLLVAGSRSAPDCVIGGIMLILVVIPAVIA